MIVAWLCSVGIVRPWFSFGWWIDDLVLWSRDVPVPLAFKGILVGSLGTGSPVRELCHDLELSRKRCFRSVRLLPSSQFQSMRP